MTNDTIITKDEAIDRMKAGLPCETCWPKENAAHWEPTSWVDFGNKSVQFRKPPEPRREARIYKSVSRIDVISGRQFYQHKWGEPEMDVREVLPGDVTLQQMTEDEAESQWEEWRCLYRWPDEARTRAAWVASRRELGIVKP